MTTPAWLIDDTPIQHKLVRILLFLTSFSWTFNPIQDYLEKGTSLEKLVTRMLPMLIIAGYCMFCAHRSSLKTMFRPRLWPVFWYIGFGVICGLMSVQPALCLWKGAEIFILLMWISVSCRDADSTRREFVAMTRMIEVLLLSTVILAVINPSLGLRRSASFLPWLQGYFPILNPNAVGFLSVAALARLLFFPAKWKPARLVLILGTLICSQSRTSYAVSVVIFVIFIIDGLRERQFLRVAAASAGAVGALAFAMGWQETIRYIVMRGQSEESLESLSGRTDYWAFAFQYISWLGKGLATGSRTLIFISGQETFMRGSVNLHNSFIEALIGGGYIGAVPYLAAIVINGVRQFGRAVLRPSISQGLFVVMTVAFAARSMTSIVLAVFSYDMVMLMICWAWLANDRGNSDARPAGTHAKPRPIVYEQTLYEQAVSEKSGINSKNSA